MQRQQPHVRRSGRKPRLEMRQRMDLAVVFGGAAQVRQAQRGAQGRAVVARFQRGVAQSDGRRYPVVVEQGAHGHRGHARVRQVRRVQCRRDAGRLGRVAVARVGQHPPVRVGGRGQRQGVRLARDPGGVLDPTGLNAQLYARGVQAGVFGRDAGGGVGLGDGAVPLLGAAQQAGEQAALVHARGVGGDHCLQRGDRRRVAGLAHPGRHQQAARVAPAVRRLRKRRPQRRHGLRGIGRLQDALDHITQPRGGVRFRGVARAAPFDRRVNHGAIPQQGHRRAQHEHQHEAQRQRLQQQDGGARTAGPVGGHRLRDDGQVALQTQGIGHGLLVRLLRQGQVRVRESLGIAQRLIGFQLPGLGVAVAAQALAHGRQPLFSAATCVSAGLSMKWSLLPSARILSRLTCAPLSSVSS